MRVKGLGCAACRASRTPNMPHGPRDGKERGTACAKTGGVGANRNDRPQRWGCMQAVIRDAFDMLAVGDVRNRLMVSDSAARVIERGAGIRLGPPSRVYFPLLQQVAYTVVFRSAYFMVHRGRPWPTRRCWDAQRWFRWRSIGSRSTR